MRTYNLGWEKEIRRLMRHFCLEEYASSVITEVKANANGTESNDVLYDRAWAKFKSLMMVS